eukprot:3429061-Rhodomonas_salina.1
MDSCSNSKGSKEVPPSVLPRAQTPANTTASEPSLPAAAEPAVTARSTNAAAWRRVPTPLSPRSPCLTPRATQLRNVTQTANLRGGAHLPSFTLLTPSHGGKDCAGMADRKGEVGGVQGEGASAPFWSPETAAQELLPSWPSPLAL